MILDWPVHSVSGKHPSQFVSTASTAGYTSPCAPCWERPSCLTSTPHRTSSNHFWRKHKHYVQEPSPNHTTNWQRSSQQSVNLQLWLTEEVCQVGLQICLSGASLPWSGWTWRYPLGSCLTPGAAGCTPALSPRVLQTVNNVERWTVCHHSSSWFFHNS